MAAHAGDKVSLVLSFFHCRLKKKQSTFRGTLTRLFAEFQIRVRKAFESAASVATLLPK